MTRPMQTVLIAMLILTPTIARGGEASSHFNVGKDRVALKGYDPVSYVDDNRAERGDAKLTAERDGIVYRFASEAHRQKFEADPARFVPAYGGWCATAIAEDHGKVDIDPDSFKVTDGRLFLFYKGWLGDARKAWVKDEPGNIVKADNNWKSIAGQ